MRIEIKEVQDKAQLKAFVKFPFGLYKNHPYWVPPLIKNEMATLTASANPAFEHSTVKLYTAWKDGKMVGRIAGIINDMEIEHIGENHARFGWIDFVDDPEVSAALIGTVEKWAVSKGMTTLKGPYGFNQLDKNGMLTEGFDTLGTMGTIYNYEYYPEHLKKLGYQYDLEWVEVDLRLADEIPERFRKFAEIAQTRYGMKVMRPQNKTEMQKLGKYLFDLMMETYRELPGFIPISDKQRDVYMKRYISFLRLDFVYVITDEHDTPIGFSVSMPSLSKAMQKAKGKLFPLGIFHLLNARRHNDTCDLALIGVKDEWRKKGVHSIIFSETGKACLSTGIRKIKINPMLEFNNNILTLWKDFEHKIYKRRKTFKKVIG